MLIVSTDKDAVEAELKTGLLKCPICGSPLRPWGYGVLREIRLRSSSDHRRFRRSICKHCHTTHILVEEDTLLRRRHSVEVIGAALVAKSKGKGHRSIARDLDIAASTVRGWLRRFATIADVIREYFVRFANTIDPSHDSRPVGGSPFLDAIEAIGMFAIVSVRRFGPKPPWLLVSFATGGRLLCNTSEPLLVPI